MAYTTINKSTDYFNTLTYTGDDGTNRSITGVGFQPDFIWFKDRSNSFNHYLFDIIRDGQTYYISSNNNAGEAADTTSLKSMDSDGFTVGASAGVNGNNNNYVAWNWKANGTGAANTAGSINSTVSVNTTSGFSVLKYTGTNGTETVGHGLGVVPKMIIIKYYTSGKDWVVYHEGLTSGASLTLNGTSTQTLASSKDYFNSTAPTSSVFTIKKDGVYDQVNNGTAGFIAYCFSDVQGYSKFGSYVGNGSTDGTFVYTGFKPAFVITKGTANISSWSMTDSTISTFNDGSLEFFKANEADGESSRSNYDILSNGFKMRTTDADYNGSGNNYIYMAFAENPLVANSGTDGVPATAR